MRFIAYIPTSFSLSPVKAIIVFYRSILPKYATYSSFTDCVNIFLNLGGLDADVTDVGIQSWCIV